MRIDLRNWGSGGPFSHVRRTTSKGYGNSNSSFAFDFGKVAGNHAGLALVQSANQARIVAAVILLFIDKSECIIFV